VPDATATAEERAGFETGGGGHGAHLAAPHGNARSSVSTSRWR
jgi:hypothetical protein